MFHSFRLASLIAVSAISLATAAAADPAGLNYRLQTQLNQRLEAQLNQLIETKLDAKLLARNHLPAVSDVVLATTGSPDLATRVLCTVSDPRTLGCIVQPTCVGYEVANSEVVEPGTRFARTHSPFTAAAEEQRHNWSRHERRIAIAGC